MLDVGVVSQYLVQRVILWREFWRSLSALLGSLFVCRGWIRWDNDNEGESIPSCYLLRTLPQL